MAPDKAEFKAKLGLVKAKFTLNLTQIQLKRQKITNFHLTKNFLQIFAVHLPFVLGGGGIIM